MAIVFANLLMPLAGWAQAPLNILDPTPRNVQVQVENSAALGVVGQSYGPAFPATYSVSGNVGTLVISAATHEQMRPGGDGIVHLGFTPIVFHFDLTTFEATSETASGQWFLPATERAVSFTLNPLGTENAAGYISNLGTPVFCSSQQEVDDFCSTIPGCTYTCTTVHGLPYDPMTGQVNLVGSETVQGCFVGTCGGFQGPVDLLTPRGDLKLTEASSASDYVYLNFAAGPGGDGSSVSPFNTVSAAVAMAAQGATIEIAPGVTSEVTVITKALTLINGDFAIGSVRIGASDQRSSVDVRSGFVSRSPR